MRSDGFVTYSRGAYTKFLHEEPKMRRLFFARRVYSTHFTRRVEKKKLNKNRNIRYPVSTNDFHAILFYFFFFLQIMSFFSFFL